MNDSVLPERSIALSPSLAASIGLEEALLLQHLQQFALFNSANGQASSGSCSLHSLSTQLPFWNAASLRRILQSLVDLGMLMLDQMPDSEQQAFEFTLQCERSERKIAASTQAAHTQATPAASLGGTRIPPNWQPGASVLEQIRAQGIDAEFALAEVAEFILYWQERNEISHSWSSKFLQHVTRRWQHKLQSAAEQAARKNQQTDNGYSGMQRGWQPNQDAVDILLRMGVNRNFIDDAIPEFVLHWRERGVEQKTWNSKFVNHIKYQWAKYTHAMANETDPAPMQENWQPQQKVYDVLALANIDENFARQLVPEFVMYWREKNELHHSWNTKFLQFVKYQWARNYRLENNGENKHGGRANEQRKTRDRSLVEDLSDRSWAG
ncbi:MAG: hypothetical protein HKO60_02725 [Pseudomonadales bacterium]|nr:hypothetical protein [Pseudomonadales bacterium]